MVELIRASVTLDAMLGVFEDISVAHHAEKRIVTLFELDKLARLAFHESF